MIDFDEAASIICKDLNSSDIIDNNENIKDECSQHNDSKNNCEENSKCQYTSPKCIYKKREYDDILKYSIMKIYK